jgi:hypothetical protein
MYLPRLCRAIFLFLVLAGSARAQLVVNPPETISGSLLVQVVDTAADDGSSAAPLFGTSAQQAAIFSDVNQIWAQAGIEVNFEFLPGTWDNSFALTGSSGNNNPRPASDLSAIVTDADSALSLDPKAIQLYMLQIVPTFSQAGSNTATGYSFTGFDGMTMWIGSLLPTTTDGQDVAASVLSHEIGRNLGLTTDTTDNQNLMNSDPTQGQYLTSSQIASADESQFVAPIPEPTTTCFLAGGFCLLFLGSRRFHRNRNSGLQASKQIADLKRSLERAQRIGV